jgi:hypothetical protein
MIRNKSDRNGFAQFRINFQNMNTLITKETEGRLVPNIINYGKGGSRMDNPETQVTLVTRQ